MGESHRFRSRTSIAGNPLDALYPSGDASGLPNRRCFAAYGGLDEFNMGAQVESFLYRAKERGITVAVTFDPKGRHDVESGRRLFPAAQQWIRPLVEPYATP